MSDSSRADSLLGILCWWRDLGVRATDMFNGLRAAYDLEDIVAAKSRWRQRVPTAIASDEGDVKEKASAASDLLSVVVKSSDSDSLPDFQISSRELIRTTKLTAGELFMSKVLKPAFRCQKCGKSYSRPAQLKSHVCVSGDSPVVEKGNGCGMCTNSVCAGVSGGCTRFKIPCKFPGCAREFKSRWDERRHLRAVHYKSKPFSCDLCDKTFGYKHHVTSHMKRAHKTDEARKST